MLDWQCARRSLIELFCAEFYLRTTEHCSVLYLTSHCSSSLDTALLQLTIVLHLISGFYILEVLPGIRSYLLMFCLCLSFSENTVICYTLSIFYLFCRERIRQWAAVYTIYIYCTRLIIYMSCKRAYF